MNGEMQVGRLSLEANLDRVDERGTHLVCSVGVCEAAVLMLVLVPQHDVSYLLPKKISRTRKFLSMYQSCYNFFGNYFSIFAHLRAPPPASCCE